MYHTELVSRRHRMSLSQSELAARLGVDVGTISRWERGTRAIPSYLHLALRYLALAVEEEQRNEARAGYQPR